MRFDQKLKKNTTEEMWQEYCGFLDLSIEEYMQIQNRLMEEQIGLWCKSPLGQKLLNGKKAPLTVDAFRQLFPLTEFVDYADILLQKRADFLPAEPVLWIETTWEGGKHPVKVAPYTKGMLEVYRNNVMGALILCTSTKRNRFRVRAGDKMLYGFAPFPYATGLFPLVFEEEIAFKYLPPLKEGKDMSFGQRNKEGFKQGFNQGIDLFFGLSSVISYITESFSDSSSGSNQSHKKSKRGSISLKMMVRYLKAKYKSKRDGVPLRPKDLFDLKGFVCAGTDTDCYKDFLEDSWGLRPSEIAAGTEPTIIGTETWNRNGLILFPDACFYEFIPEEEMYKNLSHPSYQPKTVLMDELQPDCRYELVISVLKGGAFMRYRVGDVYRCISAANDTRDDASSLPRLSFVDRIPTVIDIAGFTRITEGMIADVIKLSGLSVADWVAAKEFSSNRRPFLHLYVEIKKEALESFAVSQQILTEHLSVYFKCFDNDYSDLKRLLGIEPLVVTILRCGTIEAYQKKGHVIRRMNPPNLQLFELIRTQNATANESIPYYAAEGGTFIDD